MTELVLPFYVDDEATQGNFDALKRQLKGGAFVGGAGGGGEFATHPRGFMAPFTGLATITSVTLQSTLPVVCRAVPPRNMTIRAIATLLQSVAGPAAGHTGAYAIYDAAGNIQREQTKLNMWDKGGASSGFGWMNLSTPYEAEAGIPFYVGARCTANVSNLLGITYANVFASMGLQRVLPFSAWPNLDATAQKWQLPHTPIIAATAGAPAAPDFPDTIATLGGATPSQTQATASGPIFFLRQDDVIDEAGALPNADANPYS